MFTADVCVCIGCTDKRVLLCCFGGYLLVVVAVVVCAPTAIRHKPFLVNRGPRILCAVLCLCCRVSSLTRPSSCLHSSSSALRGAVGAPSHSSSVTTGAGESESEGSESE